MSGPAGVTPDSQECIRHGRQQVQEDVEQGAVSVQWEQQVWQPNSWSHHQHLLWWVVNPIHHRLATSRLKPYNTLFLDKTFDLDLPETEEDDSNKAQSKRSAAADMTRGSNILNKVVANRDMEVKSSFLGKDVPTYGVYSDHEVELGKVWLKQVS